MSENTRVLLFMDAMVDTRLGCVRSINEEWMMGLLKNSYTYRLTNKLSTIYSDIDDDLVKEKWKNRDKSILKLSYGTEILAYLATYIRGSINVDPEHPDYYGVDLTLNIWPYALEKEEIVTFTEILCGILKLKNVNIVNRDIKFVDPKWIGDNFDQVMMYDMSEWMSTHVHALTRTKIPRVIMTFPLIILDTVDAEGKDPREIIHYLEMAHAGQFIPDVIPLKIMSIVQPDKDSKK